MNPVAYRTARAIVRGLLRLCYGCRVRGREHIPAAGGVILAANHASFLDPPICGCAVSRPVHFLARSTLGRRGLFGRVLEALGARFIDRDGSARAGLAVACELLAEGNAIVVFPEGTRSRDGQVAEFKRGLEFMLRKQPVPVVPIGIRGSFAAWPRSRRLPRLGPRVEIEIGEPMAATQLLGPGGLGRLRDRIRDLAGEQVDPSAPAGPADSGHSPSSGPATPGRSTSNQELFGEACAAGGAGRTTMSVVYGNSDVLAMAGRSGRGPAAGERRIAGSFPVTKWASPH